MPDKKPLDQDRIPAHPPTPQGFSSQAPKRFILMTPIMASVGGLIAFFAVVLMVVILPTNTYSPEPSTNWIPITDKAMAGRAIFLSNGCVYCHSGFTRPQDVYQGQYYLYTRISEPGDYQDASESPNILGTERTGPDLSQEGGHHPDDWHQAHYWSPRGTSPNSIMPRFSFLTDEETSQLIAFNQSSGGKEGLLRYAAITVGGNLMRGNMAMNNFESMYPDLVQEVQASGDYINDGKPSDKSPSGLPWMAIWMMNSFQRSYWLTTNPLPVTQENLIRGKAIYLERCSGCHGDQGDGKGAASEFLTPPPFNFTDTSMTGVQGPFASDGHFYYRILVGGHGTAMENFGTRLSVEDIWRTVLFLRTIQNGSLETKDTLPTVDMWEPWSPPQPLLDYIDTHPISEGPGVIDQTQEDPFAAAAHWVEPGLAPGDVIYIGGKLPMTHERLTALIKQTYTQMLEQAYAEAQARGDELPPMEEIMSMNGVAWTAP